MYTAYLKGSLRLSKTGEWIHNGTPFSNRKLIDLFNRSIVWDQTEKEYFIQIGQQRASFDCEDTAYFVTGLSDQHSPWSIRLSDQTSEELRLESLSLGSESQVYCRVKGDHQARFSRAAHQTLLSHTISDDSILVDGKEVKIKRI